MDATALYQSQSFRMSSSQPSHHRLIPLMSTNTNSDNPMSHASSSSPSSSSPLDLTAHHNILSYNSSSEHERNNTKCDSETPTPQSHANGSNLSHEDTSGDSPGIDIFINNVVCTFTVRCHLNLKKIGTEGINVEYKREYGKVTMRLRKPRCTATIWSSGKITITGNDSEDNAKKAARRIARRLQNIGFRIHLKKFKVVNVLGTCRMPFAIRIADFSRDHRSTASYEPELHPAVTYKIKDPKATLKVFSTGSITVTAPCVSNIQSAIHHIYPLVEQHKMKKRVEQVIKPKPPKDIKRTVHHRKEEVYKEDSKPSYLQEEEEDEEQFLDDFDSECTDDDSDDL